MLYMTDVLMDGIGDLDIYSKSEDGKQILNFASILPIPENVKNEKRWCMLNWGCADKYAVVNDEEIRDGDSNCICLVTKNGWPFDVLQEITKKLPNEVCHYSLTTDDEDVVPGYFGDICNGEIWDMEEYDLENEIGIM